MKEYKIAKVNGKPDWSNIEALSIDVPYLDSPSYYRSWAQIAYDEEKLYVHLFCEEPYTRAEVRDPLGSPCEDCCLELFFAPMEEDGRYFNIEYNYNACIYLGLGSNVQTQLRLIPVRNNVAFEPEVRDIEGGWEIFYTVPYEFIRRFFPDFTVFSGKVMRANCYKCADLTVPEHYFSWNPIEGDFGFHRPDCFGKMIFE